MDNRKLILETATRLFMEKSYEAVGIQQVAQEVNLTKPTIYHYFKSKRGLLDSIMKEYGTLFLENQRTVSRYTGDPRGTLLETARGLQKFYKKNKNFYYLYRSMCSMALGSESYQSVQPYLEEEYSIYRTLFEAISRDHGNIGERSVVYAATFMGMLSTFIDLKAREFTYDKEDLLHRMVHQFMHGIFS